MDQTKLLLVVGIGALMAGILIHRIVGSARRRVAERAALAREVLVTVEVRSVFPEPAETYRFILADRIEEHLGDAGEVVDLTVREVPLPPGREAIDLVVRLDGPEDMPALRKALAAAGVSPSTRLSWEDRGIRATARAG